MSFYRPTLSDQKPVVPAFVFVYSWSGGVFAGCCANVACDFVAAKLAAVLVSNDMDVGGAEPALGPLALDCRLELRDAAVEGFFLFGGDGVMGGAGAAAAAVVVPSSNVGKGVFNLRKEFLDFSVLNYCVPSKMVKRPLDDLVTMCGCGRQVVKIGI